MRFLQKVVRSRHTLQSGPIMCKAREASGLPLASLSSGSIMLRATVIFRSGSARIGYNTGASGCSNYNRKISTRKLNAFN